EDSCFTEDARLRLVILTRILQWHGDEYFAIPLAFIV
ncbi:MAG: hypothetical protein RIR79_1363, partial [Pseudomonadota bacterium]